MKRLILLICSLLVMGGLISLLTVPRRQGSDPMELVPQQTLLMLDWIDAAGAARGFLDSRIGRSVQAVDWHGVMEQLDIAEPYRVRLQESFVALMEGVDDPLFKNLFGGRAICALLPMEQTELSADFRTVLAKHLLLVITPRSSRVLPAVLPAMLHLKGQGRMLSYQGLSIHEFATKNGWKVYSAVVDGQLVISPGLEIVQQSIGLSLRHVVQDRTGFVLNPEYAQLKKRGRGRDDFFVYADLARLKPLLPFLRSPAKSERIKNIPGFAGSKRMAIFHSSHGNIQQFTSIVQFDPDQLAPFQKTIYTRAPVENRSLLKMPSDLLVYFWSNWLDLPAWWQETLTRGTEAELASAQAMAAWLEEQTGMKIDQLLGLFGREFGFNIAEIRTSGFFPVPRICCCIELIDRDKVEQLMEKMIAGLPVRRDKVAGIPVVSIMAANGLMQPSYALLENFLVVADSRKQIEEMLKPSVQRLVNDDSFQSVDMGMLRPSNLVVFARTAELINGLKEFASWAGTMVAIRDETAGRKSTVLIDQVILPLLDGLKMYRAKGIRSYTAPGEVVLESALLVAEPDNG